MAKYCQLAAAQNAHSSVTFDKLEAISDKLNSEPAALAALEEGLSDEQILDLLRIEFAKIDALGAQHRINEHYQNGKVNPVRPGRQVDPQTCSHPSSQSCRRKPSIRNALA